MCFPSGCPSRFIRTPAVAVLVSIIIPVYNTEEYLPACIASILSQSFSDFELLLVDDGSTDGSGAVCDIYAKLDDRIRVFHQENGGVSSARNLGLENARGEWVYLVDSDDELFPDGLQTLVDGIIDDVDVVGGGYVQYESDGGINQAVDDRVVLTLSRNESLLNLFLSHPFYYTYLGYLWMYLFRNKIIQDHGLGFDPSIKIKEDTLFIVQYMCQSTGRTRFNTKPVYKYKMREDSAMAHQRGQYNPDYRTSFDAVVKMHACIRRLPNLGRELSLTAKQEVVDRIYMIRTQMERFNAVDEEVISSMKNQAMKEVGPAYYFSYQCRRTYKRAKRSMNRILKKQ